MNRQIKFTLTLTVIFSLISASVFAQQRKDRGFELENADELSVKIFKATKEDGRITKIQPAIDSTDPNLVFRSGELITVSYSTNFQGYIYFINVGPEGTRVIFPANEAGITPLMANEKHQVTLRLNQNTGREELILVVSRDRIQRLDDAVRSPDKMLDAQTTSLPAINSSSATPGQPAAQQQALTTQQGQVATPSQPVQLQQAGDQSGQPPKGSKAKKFFKNFGILAGSIGLSLVGGWLGPRVGALLPGGAAGVVAPSSQNPVSRGFELYQVDGNEVRARPEAGASGDLHFGAGQVGLFRMSLEHR